MKWFKRVTVFAACLMLALVAIGCYKYELDRLRPNWIIHTEADEPEAPAEEPELIPPTSPVRVPVLLYHRVRVSADKDTARERLMTVTPASFEKQMQSLADGGFVPITPDELLYALVTSTSKLPPKPIMLSFDDGFKDDFTTVLPILERLQLQATFYIVPAASKFGGFMSQDMVRKAAESGYVTIGSHTVHHADLRYLSQEERDSELRDSRALLQTWSGQPVNSFAYPYGYLNAKVEQDVAAAGYLIAFRTGAGADHTSSTRYELRRIQINENTDVIKTIQRYLK
jgi:peptidoglycan/xylan/chitin deacetylase (PgdA/CDA1 family)